MTLLVPFLIKVIRKNGRVTKLLWLITPTYLLILYLYNILTGNMLQLYETVFPAWFIFFYLGLNITINRSLWEKTIKKYGKIYFIIGALFLSLIEAELLLLIGCNSGFASSQIKFSSYFYAASLILFLNQRKERFANGRKLLKKIGDYSYGIFYIHCFVLMVIEKFLCKIGIDKIWGIYFVITWFFVSLVSFGLVWYINRVLNKIKQGYKILKYIGFK